MRFIWSADKSAGYLIDHLAGVQVKSGLTPQRVSGQDANRGAREQTQNARETDRWVGVPKFYIRLQTAEVKEDLPDHFGSLDNGQVSEGNNLLVAEKRTLFSILNIWGASQRRHPL